jgi:hypothetical protein
LFDDSLQTREHALFLGKVIRREQAEVVPKLHNALLAAVLSSQVYMDGFQRSLLSQSVQLLADCFSVIPPTDFDSYFTLLNNLSANRHCWDDALRVVSILQSHSPETVGPRFREIYSVAMSIGHPSSVFPRFAGMIESKAADLQFMLQRESEMADILADFDSWSGDPVASALLAAVIETPDDPLCRKVIDHFASRLARSTDARLTTSTAMLIRLTGDSMPGKTLERFFTQAWYDLLSRADGWEEASAVLEAMYGHRKIQRRLDRSDRSRIEKLIPTLESSDGKKVQVALARLCLVAGEFVGLDAEQAARESASGVALIAVLAEKHSAVADFIEGVFTFVQASIDVSESLDRRFASIVLEYLSERKPDVRKEFFSRLVEMKAGRVMDLATCFEPVKSEFSFEEVKRIVSTSFPEAQLKQREWEFARALFSAFPERREELLEQFPVPSKPLYMDRNDLSAIYGADDDVDFR